MSKKINFFAKLSLVVLLAVQLGSTAYAVERGVASAAASVPMEYPLSWHSLHMGTVISGKVFAKTPEETRRLAELVEAAVAKYDDMMSVHKVTPLNEVNLKAGERVPVPCEVAQMAKTAFEVADESDGAFEPMIGPIVNLWRIGFGGHEVPSERKIQETLKLVNHQHVEVRQENEACSIRIEPGQNMDMGGIAKGYIGQKLAELLKANGVKHGLLDLGGNVVAIGEKSPGHPWMVGLQQPDQSRGDYFAVVKATDVSVITSGAYERNFVKDGKRYGHILSAKTGRPVLTDLSSVSIVDADGAKADAWCTALFAMGWDKSIAFLKHRPDIHAVLMNADMKRVAYSQKLMPILSITDRRLQAFPIEQKK